MMKRPGARYALFLMVVAGSVSGWAADERWHAIDISEASWILNTPQGYLMPNVRHLDEGMEITLEKGQGVIGYIADVVTSGTHPVYVEALVEVSSPEIATALAVMNTNDDSYASVDGTFGVAMPLDSDTLMGTGRLSQLIAAEGGHIGIALQAVLPLNAYSSTVAGVTVQQIRYILSEEVGAEAFGVEIVASDPAVAETLPASITVDIPWLSNAVVDATPLEMVLIEANTFAMGSLSFERGRENDEGPIHEVEITKPYYIGRYEVTQAQWELLMSSNPSRSLGANHPVEQVSWDDCQGFIAKLNELGQGTFRLPTEAEWEYACRAGAATRFSFGDASECSDLREYCEQMDMYMWWRGNDTHGQHVSGTKTIAMKAPNPWGLYDMHGNVAEWCLDRYSPYTGEAQTDPQGPSLGSNRVLRGGSWNSYAQDCRSAARDSYSYKAGRYTIGFRVVKSVE